jgi:sporulation protein YlmC with PRC-barrel domain
VRTLSSLIGRSVETESGLPLGTCHDLRGELSGSGLEVVALSVGPTGLLDRLGIKPRGDDEVAWSSIVRIDGDRIVVRDP